METALALPHSDSAEMEWEYRKNVDFYLATGQRVIARIDAGKDADALR